MHSLPKEAQLIEPLYGTAAIAMDKEERPGCILGVYIYDADSP